MNKYQNTRPDPIAENQIDRLKENKVRWFAVLLTRDVNSGYLFTKDEVIQRINSGKFELSNDGDYKVNENTDCEKRQAFQDLEAVLNWIL